MPTQPTPFQVSLVGIASSDQHRIFSSLLPGYETDMEAGNHLRWFFSHELGFPKKFTVYRSDDVSRRFNNDILIPGKLVKDEWIRSIITKEDAIAIFSYDPLENVQDFYSKGDSMRTPPPLPFLSRTAEIQSTLARLTENDDSASPYFRRFERTTFRNTDIKPIDALLLATLDPFIAMLTGLYFIDRNAPQGVIAYYIEADYGDKPFPLMDIDIQNKQPDYIDQCIYKTDKCAVTTITGSIRIGTTTAHVSSLHISPAAIGATILQVFFDSPVVEVVFWVNSEWNGRVSANFPNGLSGYAEINENKWIIRPTQDLIEQFNTLTLSIEGIGQISISKIQFRSKRGTIGKLYSNACLLNKDYSDPTTPLHVTGIRQSAMPPMLDDNGFIDVSKSKIQASFSIDPDSSPQFFYFSSPKPIRYLVARSEESRQALNTAHPGVLLHTDPTYNGLLLYVKPSNTNFVNQADGNTLIVEGGFSLDPVFLLGLDLRYIFEKRMPLFEGRQFLLMSNRQFNTTINQFTIGAVFFLRSQLAEGEKMTFFDNTENAVWFGLINQEGRVRVRLVINGVAFVSLNANINLSQNWHRIIANYDGRSVKIFIDAAAPERFPTDINQVWPSTFSTITIGASTNNYSNTPMESFFKGYLDNLFFWTKKMTPSQVKTLLSSPQNKNIPTEVESPHLRNPLCFSDLYVPDGQYNYIARGIDVFGRLSDWGRSMPLEVKAEIPAPASPQSVKARFLTYQGIINRAEKQVGNHYFLEVSLRGANTIVGLIDRHDLTISRKVEGVQDLSNPGASKEYEIRQNLEIGKPDARNEDLLIINAAKLPPFAQIFPTTGDPVVIQVDKKVEVEWQWTGLQQVYSPEVTSFDICHLPGAVNVIEATLTAVNSAVADFELSLQVFGYTFVTDLFKGRMVDINNRLYEVVGHNDGTTPTIWVHYKGEPVIRPTIGDKLTVRLQENDPGYVDLKNATTWYRGKTLRRLASRETGIFHPISSENRIVSQKLTPEAINLLRKQQRGLVIDWIPEADAQHPEQCRLWRLSMEGLVRPQGYENPTVAGFVPDALVVATLNKSHQKQYEVIYILWHQWEKNGSLHLYADLTQPPTEASDTEQHEPPTFLEGETWHLYFGQRFQVECTLPDPVIPAGKAVQPHQITVFAKGTSSRMSAPAACAIVPAVDRQKPPEPAQPEIVSFDKADYNNLSKVEITWAGDANIKYYNLYRATDADIFAADLENRRLQQGSYAGKSLADILAGDTGIAHLNAFKHKQRAAFDEKLSGDWSALQESDLFVTDKQSTAWKQASYFWNYWAAWYYPMLDNAEIKALAEKEGNESAFTLVNSSPLEKLVYTDAVNGAVNNLYFYRLRSQGQNLAQSTQWGKVSLGENAETPAVPPRTPVFTKVEAGDRQVTLQWALNREPDLKGYVLYRSRQKELLDDLRWFEAESPNGNALVQRIEIPDPRIVVRNGRIVISDEVPIERIVGVYRAEEYDFSLPLGERQVQAVNFWGAGGRFSRVTGRYELNLGGGLGDGAEVVVVVINNLNNIIMINYGIKYPFVDVIESLIKVNYRIIANTISGQYSQISQLTTGVAF